MSKYGNPFAQYYTAPPVSYGADGVPILHAGGQYVAWKQPLVVQPVQGIRRKRPIYTIDLPGKGTVIRQPPIELPDGLPYIDPANGPVTGGPAKATPPETKPDGASFDPIAWAKENPLIVAGIAAAAFFMLKGK